MVIFIDESGTLPDKSDRYIILAALVADNPDRLDKILPKFRRKTPTKGPRKKEKQVKEFKFHYVGDITKEKVLKEIASLNIKIYLLVVDKIGRKIPDTPENYGKLIKRLILVLIKKEHPKQVYFDKHFSSKSDTEKFETLLNLISQQIQFKQVDSLADPRIDLADFIAGAALRKYRANDNTFYNIILSKVIWEKVESWNKL